MNLDFAQFLEPDFDPQSRVWIYQSSRLFTMGEALEIEMLLAHFTANWNSHGAKVKGAGHLFFGQFICLLADETSAGVSGCSTDSSVRLIQEIGQKFSVAMFDRLSLAFVVKEKVQLVPMAQLQYAFQNQFITGDTLYFNNVVQTRQELVEKWIVPVKDSWLKQKLPIDQPA